MPNPKREPESQSAAGWDPSQYALPHSPALPPPGLVLVELVGLSETSGLPSDLMQRS